MILAEFLCIAKGIKMIDYFLIEMLKKYYGKEPYGCKGNPDFYNLDLMHQIQSTYRNDQILEAMRL